MVDIPLDMGFGTHETEPVPAVDDTTSTELNMGFGYHMLDSSGKSFHSLLRIVFTVW